MNGLHGTAAVHADAIRAEGLREPYPGRGVALVTPELRWFAVLAAQCACTVLRDRNGGDYEHAEGLVVHANLAGLVGVQSPRGVIDAVPTVFVRAVPATPGARPRACRPRRARPMGTP